MAEVFKNASFHVNDKKCGMADQISVDLMSGSESIITDDGWQALSQGKRHVKITLSQYAPIGGKGEIDAIYLAWKNGTPLERIKFGVWNGRVLTWDKAGVISCKIPTDPIKGFSKFDAEIEAGKPDG